jgi:hypothetical protein
MAFPNFPKKSFSSRKSISALHIFRRPNYELFISQRLFRSRERETVGERERGREIGRLVEREEEREMGRTNIVRKLTSDADIFRVAISTYAMPTSFCIQPDSESVAEGLVRHI